MVVAARVDILGRFDDGIAYTTVTYLLHGQIPFTDFYEPYGVGLGIPGVLPHLFGFDGAFALRLTYGLFPPLVTLLVTVLVSRRSGGGAGVLVGLITLTSQTPRYSMGFAALFCFALIVDRTVRRTATGTLQEAAERRPGWLLTASFVCSLAGWARTEYAVFAALWAVTLLIVLPAGRRRWTLAAGTLVFAALPSLLVLITGGLERLWWFIGYIFSSSPSGFHVQRGQPIEWQLLEDRLSELLRLQLGSSTAGEVVGSYGVGAVVILVALLMALVPAWRSRLLKRDGSYLTPFLVVVCAVVLYGQAARFSTTYGTIGNPVFWAAGALLIGRPSNRLLIVLAMLVALPFAAGISPGGIYDMWASRLAVTNRVVVPGFNRIPMVEDGGAASMAALVLQWRKLGLEGRSTVSVELRNDVAWGNEAIVGFLLNAPAAAWPLTYDPGLVNTATVERATVADLCHNRAPVVQANADYPYPAGKAPYVGSRLLDEFLAADYEVAAFAGFYRILLPSSRACVLPRQLSNAELQRQGEGWLKRGELAAAGALAILRMERAQANREPVAGSDAALAALGGYTLASNQVPHGLLGNALQALSAPPGPIALAAAAAYLWPTDYERLAAQTAWIEHRSTGEAGTQQAMRAVYELVIRHPGWPTAMANLSAIEPPSRALFARLERTGSWGMPEFDRWRRGFFLESGDTSGSIAAGLALIADYDRLRDPIKAGEAELELATYPGITPACALALRHHASLRPGVRVQVAPGGPACLQPDIAAHVG